MPDVLIAGGGIAGSALALMLGRCGLSVELFERGHFPREKPCGEGLMPPGVAVLERWGLAEAIGGTPFYGVRYRFGERALCARFPAAAPGAASACGRGQRRRVLDAALFRAAAATPGVCARTGAPVEAPILENGRVVGLRAGGAERRAALVVAADGAHSRQRHQLGLDVPPRRRRMGLRAHFRLAAGQSQPPWVDVFVQPGRELYVTPLPEGEVQVAALAEADSFDASKESAAERAFERWWRSEPALAARLEGAERAGELAGMSPLAGRARRGVLPGMVLLGDAAGFIDPITGGGMAQALLSAELLAGYIARAGQTAAVSEEDAWLDDFERDRRRMLRNYRWMTQALLWLAGRRRAARLTLGSAALSPAILSHLLGVAAGMRPFLGRSFGSTLGEALTGSLAAPPEAWGASAAERATAEGRHAIL